MLEEDIDRSERLTREEGDALRNLLLYLRYVMRHKFVVIAQKVGVRSEAILGVTSGRSRGTKRLRERIYQYAEERRVPIEVATGLGSTHGFRSELNISDETLNNDSARLAGRYLAFTLLSTDPSERVGVTLLTLYVKQEGESLPEFSSWRHESRGSVQHKGYYYLFDGGLYLVGHTLMTGYPRMICLQPNSLGVASYFHGTISAASHDDLSFQSWCVIKRTSKSLLRMRKEGWISLGIFGISELEISAPEVVSVFQGKSVQRIARLSASHG